MWHYCPTGVRFQVTQLTGFSDPVYAEAYVHVNQYDIVLDVLVVNQTSDTLQNCTLELATLGELLLHEQRSDLLTAVYISEYQSVFFFFGLRWSEVGWEALTPDSGSPWFC